MEFDIQKVKRKLLIKYPGFSTVITNMNYIPSYGCLSNGHPTAATDGKNFIYHPDFMNGLSEDKQLAVAAHEVSHIALDHIKRSEGKDPKIWNIATDAVINVFLKEDGLPLIEGAIDMDEAKNYDAETLYEKLLKDKQNNKNDDSSNSQDNSSGNGNDSRENNDVGHDTHSMWDETVKNSKEQSSSQFEDTNLEKEQEENSKLGEKEVFKNNREKREENLKKLRDSLASQSANCGKGVSSSYRQIDDIGSAISLIDWKTILKNTVNSKIDWSYKNATIEDGVITPHLETLSSSETEILLDTSGSIDEELLRNFLRECKGILHTSHIKVGCFDTRFFGFNEIKRESDIDNMKFPGGGGTDFDVAVNAFTKRVDNRIIFTDGWADMPKLPLDAIWIVFGSRKINPKGGRVIYIDEHQLDKLKFTNESDNLNVRIR